MTGRRLVLLVSVAVLIGCRGRQKPMSESVPAEPRAPAVAGSFYSAGAADLRAEVDGYLEQARRAGSALPEGEEPVVVLVPHAGYVFSGQCAAFAFAALEGRRFDRVVLLGSPHTMAVNGAAVWRGAGFQTPLGVMPVDEEFARALAGSSSAFRDDRAPHLAEHSLEVELPFLQRILGEVSIVPILVMGEPAVLDRVADAIAEAVRSSSGGFPRTLVVVSTDLSHYPAQADAVASDRQILAAFCSLDPQKLLAADRAIMARKVPNLSCSMCGIDAAYVGLRIAREAGAAAAHLLDRRTSAEAGVSGAGADSVVGYGAVLISRPTGAAPGISLREPLAKDEQAFLLRIARSSIETYLKTGQRPVFTPPAGCTRVAERRGCFVSLYVRSGGRRALRGCIGSHVSDLPLVQLVPQMAIASAFSDPRFPPLAANELRDLSIELSVYRTGVVPIASPDEFVVGEQGIVLEVGGAEATFLPQVAREQGWDRTATFENLCLKAGLDRDAWKRRDARFSVYVTQAFGE